MPVVRLDSTFISKKLTCPDSKSRIEWCCDTLKGLYIEVRAVSQGEGTYYLRGKSNAKTCHHRLGKTTEISLAEARKMATTLKAKVALGSDPHAEAKARDAAMTFSTFFEDEYMPYVRPRKRSHGRDEEIYKLRLRQEFGHFPIHGISRRHVQAFHASLVSQHGLAPATADHHVKLMRAVLNRALEWETIEKNPLKGIKLFSPDNRVENVPNDEQMERLLHVLMTDANRTACLIALFLLCTGCRLNEALQARWSQIDEQAGMWRLPANSTKAARSRSVPLNPSAVYVIQQLDTRGKYEYLFVNKKTGTRFVGLMKVWSRLREKAGLPRLRLHDLRHCYASRIISDGGSLVVVSQLLGHADVRVTARYLHWTPSALKQAANSASVLIKPVKAIGAA